MSVVRVLCMCTVVGLLSTGFVFAQTSQQANVIENIVALQVAQAECGAKVNYEMLATVMAATNIRSDDLLRGGKYFSRVERDQRRVRRLIATEAGKASFCRSVRTDLSAMLD